ncbi:hypothetical protein F2Q70_00041886 [Brassica cretica]|uniref:Uncharacterized protein n=1 Tax=Brassica cretica TaxID=69181 RepID=A0A8S9K7S2_BRACR|nr:hypothetical protein F2Q70_00041886 [Brassica cretica]KAF3498849.1 hypothetical protein DY000_02057929 [Brassica cretica]
MVIRHMEIKYHGSSVNSSGTLSFQLSMYSTHRAVHANAVKSAVTGEHTCMLLKPLNKDEFEVSESNELGFFGPFYTG